MNNQDIKLKDINYLIPVNYKGYSVEYYGLVIQRKNSSPSSFYTFSTEQKRLEFVKAHFAKTGITLKRPSLNPKNSAEFKNLEEIVQK